MPNRFEMKRVTLSRFQSNTKELLGYIEHHQKPLTIFEPKKKNAFIVITSNEYNALKETLHLLSTEANTIRLMEGIKQAEGLSR